MKTIMILSNVPDGRVETSLQMAAGLGYRRVFCGPEDARARALADSFYLSDWNDTDELIQIAKQEHIDGVIGLTDPSVLPAAKVAQALGLPGNTPASLEKLISKHEFRILQKEAGLFCPQHAAFLSFDEIGNSLAAFHYPLIVKPRLCSSSYGQTILEDAADLEAAFAAAAEKSRDHAVCIEEYIDPESLCTTEADVFVVGDEILWEGLRDSWHREEAKTRPLYDVHPAHLTEQQMESFRRQVSGALKAAGVCLGEFNVEGFFTRSGDFFVVEINARQAGYYNPQHIKLCNGVDLTKLLVTTAVGDMSYYTELKDFRRTARNILSYSIFARKEGILDHIYIAPEMKARLIAYDELHESEPGDHVEDYKTAHWPIVQAAFEFETEQELEAARRNIDDLVYAVTV